MPKLSSLVSNWLQVAAALTQKGLRERERKGMPLIDQGDLTRTQQSSPSIACLLILGYTCD